MSNEAQLPIDPQFGLMVSSAEHLIPLFRIGGVDTPLARRMAISAMYAYEPETRADFVNVARTIAFSMASLALLGKAAAEDMPLAAQMRAYGRANALNRSADQSERTMMQRRRHQLAHPPADQADAPAPEPDIDDAEMEASIAGAMRECLAACRAPATEPDAPQVAAAPARANPARSPATAVQYDSPISETGQPGASTYKQRLLHHSAIQRVVAPGASPGPL